MKKSKVLPIQTCILALLLLGGCVLMEDCAEYLQLAGQATRDTAYQTLEVTHGSKTLIDRLEGGEVATGLEDAGEGWYKITLTSLSEEPIDIRVSEGDSNYVEPGAATWGSLTKVELSVDTTEDEQHMVVNLAWTTPTSTPTGNGTFDFYLEGIDGNAQFTDITYATSGDDEYFPNSGTTEVDWDFKGNPLMPRMSLTLTFSSDLSAYGIIDTVNTQNYATEELDAITPYSSTGASDNYEVISLKDKDGNEVGFIGTE